MENVVSLHAKSVLIGPVKTEIAIRDFHSFHIDEPKEFGGSDSAPNPMEYILAGLNGCESVILKMIAKELNMDVDNITIYTTGEIDVRGMQGVDGIRPHFQTIKQDFMINVSSGKDKVDQLFRSMKERCPAYNLMKDADISLEMNYTVQ